MERNDLKSPKSNRLSSNSYQLKGRITSKSTDKKIESHKPLKSVFTNNFTPTNGVDFKNLKNP